MMMMMMIMKMVVVNMITLVMMTMMMMMMMIIIIIIILVMMRDDVYLLNSANAISMENGCLLATLHANVSIFTPRRTHRVLDFPVVHSIFCAIAHYQSGMRHHCSVTVVGMVDA